MKKKVMIATIFAVLMLMTPLITAVESVNKTNTELIISNSEETTIPGSFLGILDCEEGHMVEQTDDGGYIIIGDFGEFNPHGVGLTKLNAEGGKQWEKTYSGRFGFGVQQTSDGGYIIAASDESYPKGIVLIKTDDEGEIEWRNSYEGQFWNCHYGDRIVQQTNDGGYIVTGRTSEEYAVALLIKTDANGNEEWRKDYGFGFRNIGKSVQQTDDNGFIVLADGYTSTPDWCKIFLIKTDNYGNIEWNKTFSGSGNLYASSIQQTNDGSYIFSGGDGFEGWITKTDEDGNIEWNKNLVDYNCDRAWSVQQTSDNGFIVTGGRRIDFFYATYVVLIKLDENGIVEWNKTFIYEPPGHTSDGYCVRQTTDGGYIITGVYYFGEIILSQKLLVIKTDENGNMEWQLSRPNALSGQPNSQLLQRLSQQLPNAFPILRQLLGL